MFRLETIVIEGIRLIGPYGVNEAYNDHDLWKSIVNGCGPEGSKRDLVPDSACFLPIGEICELHDFSWHSCAGTREEFSFWNDIFEVNLRNWIKSKTSWYNPLLSCRLRRAWIYHKAVNSTIAWNNFLNSTS